MDLTAYVIIIVFLLVLIGVLYFGYKFNKFLDEILGGYEKKEKIQHLKTLLENIKLAQDRGGRVGFCLCLPWRVDISEFPELLAYKPDVLADQTYWFPRKDYQTRIDIVEKVIKELEDSIPWYVKLFS